MTDFNISYRKHIQRSKATSQENSEASKSAIFSGIFDRFFIPAYLTGAVGAFAVIFITGVGSNMAFFSSWGVFYCLTFVALLCKKVIPSGKEYIIFILPLYYILTTFWSLQPDKTLLYSILILLNCLFSLYLVHRVNEENIMRLIMYVIITLCFLGLVLNVVGFRATDYIDIHHRSTVLGTHPIRGLFFHKIAAGYFSGLAAVLCLVLMKGAKKFGFIFFLFVFNLLTGSSAGLAMFFIGFVIYFAIKVFKRFRVSSLYLVLLIIFGAMSSVVLFHYVGAYVLSLLDRDPTMTGRTLMWQIGLDVSLEKFLYGWGYLGYNGTDVAAMDALVYPEFNNYAAPHFHNSYIQFIVDAGWIWGSFFIGTYFYTLAFWYRKYTQEPNASNLAMSCTIFYMMISGVFIHTLGRYNDLSMIIFFYAFCYSLTHKQTSINSLNDTAISKSKRKRALIEN